MKRSWRRTARSRPRRRGLGVVSEVSHIPHIVEMLTENEDLACFESTLELINEMIVPRDGLCNTVCRTPGRLRGVQVARLDHDANSLECVGDDLALRRANNVGFPSED